MENCNCNGGSTNLLLKFKQDSFKIKYKNDVSLTIHYTNLFLKNSRLSDLFFCLS